MTEIFKVIANSTLEVFDANNNIVSYAFVLTFANKKDKDTIRPFLIVNKSVVEKYDFLYVKFNATDNTEIKEHRISFSKNLIPIFQLNNCDILALPLAQTLNELDKNKIQIKLNDFPADLIPDQKKIAELNEVNLFTWFSFDKTINSKICHQNNNVTLLDNDLNLFFKSDEAVIGAPVFIINVGAFSSNDGVCFGTRVNFMGCFEYISGQYAKLRSGIDLVKGIKEKFHFD